MSQRYIIVLLLLAAAIHAAAAKDPNAFAGRQRQDRAHLPSGYRSSVATQHNLWSQLTPFLRSKAELDHLIVDCSSQHCSGSIRLRDDAEVLYTSVHVPPEHSKVGPGDLTPDIEYKGSNRFVGVARLRYSKVIFRQGDLPEWFIDQHKH